MSTHRLWTVTDRLLLGFVAALGLLPLVAVPAFVISATPTAAFTPLQVAFAFAGSDTTQAEPSGA